MMKLSACVRLGNPWEPQSNSGPAAIICSHSIPRLSQQITSGDTAAARHETSTHVRERERARKKQPLLLNRRHPTVVIMLCQRRRRWHNIMTTVGENALPQSCLLR